MHQLTIVQNGKTLVREFTEPLLLSQAIQECSLALSMPCGGNHSCGKCRVMLQGGSPNPPSPQEARLLTPQELQSGLRLACFTSVAQSARVELPSSRGEHIASGGQMPAFTSASPFTGPLGAAIDIGTTTVVVYLYELATARLLATCAAHNRQAAYGADVLSRITFACGGGQQEIGQVICSQLAQMLAECLEQAGRPLQELTACVITGNTTMLHLLAGLDTAGIAVAPFTPTSLFGCFVPELAARLGLAPQAQIYLPSCAGAYVGGDITCALLAAELPQADGCTLLVDIGTNGEMVLAKDGQLLACSTAAGPAFEGAGIRMGMPAARGAVSAAWVEGNAIRWQTIENAPAIGICGSGLLDLAAAARQLELLDETGRLQPDAPGLQAFITQIENAPALCLPGTPVVVTQADIRQLQLAKAAIAAGIDTLIEHARTTPEALSQLYLAGGFGSYLNIASAGAIGLLPKALCDKTTVLGNAAGSGASLALLSSPHFEQAGRLGGHMQELSLSESPTFMEHYIENMLF